jgi:2-C-methyl-D-erythritol 4-phosphate cytidylyltransferase
MSAPSSMPTGTPRALFDPTGVWTIVLAGGNGQRFGAHKQFLPLGPKAMVAWAVDTALQVSAGVVVVVPEVSDFTSGDARVHVVQGGASRTESVRNGLAEVPTAAQVVCVHDAARPFASVELFQAVVQELSPTVQAAVPALAVVDTVKVINESTNEVLNTPLRSTLRAVQTPQAFHAGILREAHLVAEHENREGTDDASLVEAIGGYVVVVPGNVMNRKITTPEDFAWAQNAVSEVLEGNA